MSKNMKASAFSCGDSVSVAAAAVGDSRRGTGPPDTCMSENTTLPQREPSSTSFGVVNWKFCVPPPWFWT